MKLNASFLAAFGLLVASPGLLAQSSPVGLGFAYLAPSGVAANNFKGGGALSLYIHKDFSPVVEGRLHLDALYFPGKDFRRPEGVTAGQFKSEAKGFGVGYDWLFNFNENRGPGAYALLGIGGVHWTEDFTAQNDVGARDPYKVVDSNDFTSFSVALGLGVRLSRNVGLELKHTETRTNHIHFFGTDETLVDAGLSNTSLGLTVRF